MQLNSEQEEAVNTVEGPLLVLAGAGSGKTRVVTQRIIHLLNLGVPSDSILAVTFTNKAAAEMQDRVRKETDQGVLISTFHSLGSKILRESIHVLGYPKKFTIYDEEDSIKLLKSCLEELNIQGKQLEPKVFRHLISKSKNDLIGPDDVSSQGSEAEMLLPRVYEKYQENLKAYHAVDFDDLLYLVVILFKEHPDVLKKYQDRWHFLLIDEYQDTNKAQYKMMRMLAGERCNICAVGDPDQSIYSWRGAKITNILNFEKDYEGGKVIRLEKNYRSTMNILEAANAVISNNYSRYEKQLWSDLGQGEKIKLFQAKRDRDEARFVAERVNFHHENDEIPLSDTVVFYRTNFQSRVFEDYLIDHGISYTIVGGISFYQRREVKDVLAYMRLIQTSSDFISFARTINLPKRGIGGTTVEKIRQGANYEGVPVVDFCAALISPEGKGKGIRLSAKQKEGIAQYLETIATLRAEAKDGKLHDVIQAAIRKSGYLDVLKADPETASDRIGNLDALVAKAIEWEMEHEEPTLEGFLEELTLKSSLDEVDQSKDKLNLMTIHNGKGLEFSLVFVVGMEEDLFPHINAKGNQEAQEEERRLFYVGMTRARRYLYITLAKSRYLWGTERFQRASRFIDEIPGNYVQHVGSRPTSARKPVEWIEEESFIDDVDQTVQDDLAVGDVVMHHDFGAGVIQDAYEGSMGLMFKVHFFRDKATKSLVARLAHLKKG